MAIGASRGQGRERSLSPLSRLRESRNALTNRRDGHGASRGPPAPARELHAARSVPALPAPLPLPLYRPAGARFRTGGAAFGSGIHAAAAVFFRGVGQGARPNVEDVQAYFESFWKLEAGHQPLRYGERESREGLLDLGRRMLAVLCEQSTPGTQVLAVEQPFAVPLIDLDTGEVLDRDLVGTWDLLERDAEGFVVVDLETSARKYTDLQVEASLQLSVYKYAVGLSPWANGDDVRLAFDVLTKTRAPELHRYWTTRDRAANVRLFRLVSELLGAIEAGAFYPERGVAVQGLSVQDQVLGVEVMHPPT